MSDADTWAEWKAGYRDGLGAGVTVARVCAAEPGATATDVLILLETLSESSVIQPDPGGFTHHVETPHPPPLCNGYQSATLGRLVHHHSNCPLHHVEAPHPDWCRPLGGQHMSGCPSARPTVPTHHVETPKSERARAWGQPGAYVEGS